jgi:hypothetical protein
MYVKLTARLERELQEQVRKRRRRMWMTWGMGKEAVEDEETGHDNRSAVNVDCYLC